MLLFADWVIPVSSAPLADAGVRVEGGVIREVGPAAQLRAGYEGEEVRTFPGCALLPGFVNSHSHLELSALRGLSRPAAFGRWMFKLVSARRTLDRNDFEASALWGAREAARCGITSLADTSYDGFLVANATAAAGLRARVYQEVFGLDESALPRIMERYEAVMARLREQGERAARDGLGRSLVEVGVSPHAPYTVSLGLYREAARFARRADLHLATHVAESMAEVEFLARGTGPIIKTHRVTGLLMGPSWQPPGMRPLEYVAKSGALSPEALVIHAVEVDKDEIDLLAASGAAVAHCPRSNARLRCGVAPVAEYLAAGIRVGLGTDSLASNQSLDMFAEMRAALAAAEQRAAARPPGAGKDGSPAVLTPEQALAMATLEGARALGWGSVTGSLEPGKSADVVAVGLGDAGKAAAGAGEVVGALVGAASASRIRMTMAAGNVVFTSGENREPIPGLRAMRDKLGLRG